MTVNGIAITDEAIKATRVHFADIERACIADILDGRVRVEHPAVVIKWHEDAIPHHLAGKWDHTLTFIQAALCIQTGECISILS